MDYLLGGICLGLVGVVFVARAVGGFSNAQAEISYSAKAQLV